MSKPCTGTRHPAHGWMAAEHRWASASPRVRPDRGSVPRRRFRSPDVRLTVRAACSRSWELFRPRWRLTARVRPLYGPAYVAQSGRRRNGGAHSLLWGSHLAAISAAGRKKVTIVNVINEVRLVRGKALLLG